MTYMPQRRSRTPEERAARTEWAAAKASMPAAPRTRSADRDPDPAQASRSPLHNEQRTADIEHAKAVVARDLWCRSCGSDFTLQCHHVVRRGWRPGRHHADNGVALCVDCHTDVEQRRVGFEAWKIDTPNGKEWLDNGGQSQLPRHRPRLGRRPTGWVPDQ